MELIRVLKDQKQELEEDLKNKKIIKREVENYFSNVSNSKLIKIASGIRRCGKSVFIHTLLKTKNFAYINFDDERLYDMNTDGILSSFYEIYGKEFKVVFFDEIQNLNKWELFVNRLHRAGFNVFITGSNSRLLSRDLATHLTGRHINIELFPFSFREYLTAVGFGEDIGTTRGEGILKRELKKYLEDGGFPEIIVEKENPKIYIRELYRKIIERDIIQRYNISYKKTFREISMSLLSNPARKISYNKIKNNFNLGSEHTVKNYLSYLEEAYIIFLVNRFSYKPVEVEKSEKKVYIIDNGLITNLSTKFIDDYGHIYENTIAIELQRRKFYQDIDFYYWKNEKHEEVDFVIKEGLKIKQLIQACYDIEDYETKERETRAIIKASNELKCSNLLIITKDYEGEEKIKGKKIKFIPLWKWLLEK